MIQIRRGTTWVSDVHVCMHKHARLGRYGGMFPQEIFRCSEIASEAILGHQQSGSNYMARGVLHPIFGCPCMHLQSQLTWNFYERRYYGWQNSRWGDIRKTSGELSVERLK